MNQEHFAKLVNMYNAAPCNEYYAPSLSVYKGQATVSITVRPKMFHAGGALHGYQSDNTRTWVFDGPVPERVDRIWNIVRDAQRAAYEAIRPGVPCREIDRVARDWIDRHGFGPGYRVPGLPHRTGHGIGLDGHEWVNLVEGNTRPMEVGMCFSNEPMVVLPGEFGIRLEDCIHITEDGPRYFSTPSPAIDQPFA